MEEEEVIFWHAAYGILFPQPGMEPMPSAWKHRVLTTEPPGYQTLPT